MKKSIRKLVKGGPLVPERRPNRRWRVKWNEASGCWLAYPVDYESRFTRGWAFARWEDAVRFASSDGIKPR